MTRRPWISKKLAERRRKEYQLHLAGYTQEEIADKVGVHRSVVSRDLQAFRDSICPGEPPDVQEAYYVQMASMIFNPEPGQFDPRHPPLAGTSTPEDAAASWNERRIYEPLVDGYGAQLKLLFVWRIFAHLNTCRDISYTCRNMPKHACTSPHMPARPRNCLLRSTSHCVNDTYINLLTQRLPVAPWRIPLWPRMDVGGRPACGRPPKAFSHWVPYFPRSGGGRLQ